MKALRKALRLSSALALVATIGCTTDSPSEPRGGSGNIPPKPPDPVSNFTVTVTANPSQLTAGSTTPSVITVEVRRDGQVPPDLTPVTLTTSLGGFGAVGGAQSVQVQLVNGRAQANLFAGAESGTATVRAEVKDSNGVTIASGVTNVGISQAATFFVSSVDPSVGDPAGGQQVAILGGGFESPVRVTFGAGPATVRSVTSNRIVVSIPSAAAAGVTVGVGQAASVPVTVTINVNESNQAVDSIPNGFTYALGGGIDQPQVFSVSPSLGTNDGGTRVTIIGSGFAAPVQVFFGLGTGTTFTGVEATVESVSGTQIIAVTPPARGFGHDLQNQPVNVMVKNVNTGFSTIAQGLFRYGVKVIITAMGPGSGPFTGGTQVTLHGSGFDDPVAVSLGGVGQGVLSVTGTQILFVTSGVVPSSCPSNGIITVTGVSVTNIETGDSAQAALGFNYVVPKPQIFGISPTSGGPGTAAVITGENFATNVQVLFGDATNGSSAPVGAHSSTSISVTVPSAPSGFSFSTEPCDGNGDGIPGGTRLIPTAISVNVKNLDQAGCVATLSNSFLMNPPNTTCTGDTSTPPPPPQCSDGIDNDSDTFIDFPTDPQCSSALDNSEAS